jgi:hypothetical protein
VFTPYFQKDFTLEVGFYFRNVIGVGVICLLIDFYVFKSLNLNEKLLYA